MFKLLKKLTSLVAVFAVLFTFTTETMAAKKSKTLKNVQKKGFLRDQRYTGHQSVRPPK